MRLQTNNEFQQVKIKDLSEKYKMAMFKTNVQGGKTFASEQKIRELQNRISKIKTNIRPKQTKNSPDNNN